MNNLNPELPETKGNPVPQAPAALIVALTDACFDLFGARLLNNGKETPDETAAVRTAQAALLEALNEGKEALDLLARVYPQVFNPEDRAHIRELMSVTTPYMPEAK